MGTGVWIFGWRCFYISGISAQEGNGCTGCLLESAFLILKEAATPLCRGAATLCSQRQWVCKWVGSRPPQHCLVGGSLYWGRPDRSAVTLVVVEFALPSRCTAERLFMPLSPDHQLQWNLFSLLCSFSNWLFAFLLFNFEIYLPILGISPLSDLWPAHIVSWSVCSLYLNRVQHTQNV